MSAAKVEQYNKGIEVVFHGYIPINEKKWFCVWCFERLYTTITEQNEHLFLTRSYIKLNQLRDTFHTDKSNYCSCCSQPLYNIASETCLLSSPTSNKWLHRFKVKRHYGLRGGGTCRSTEQWN